MGFMVNNLAELPVSDSINLYVFTINGEYRGGDYETVKKNFRYLAKEFGQKAAIVEGFDDYFSNDIAQNYLNKNLEDLWDVLPALLVTDAHPSSIPDDALRLLIPLRHVEERFPSFEVFFRELIKFTKEQNPDFLERFEDKTDWVSETLDVVDLKPNFFGIGVNINAFINKIRGKSA
jgi:hypothetical protein